MSKFLSRFLRRDEAATAVEYAVVLALILMVCFGTVALVGLRTSQSWSNSNSQLQSVMTGS